MEPVRLEVNTPSRRYVITLGDAFRGHASGGAGHSVRFQQRTQLEHVVTILAGPFRDDRPLMRHEFEQPFRVQLAQRFARDNGIPPCVEPDVYAGRFSATASRRARISVTSAPRSSSWLQVIGDACPARSNVASSGIALR